MRVGQNANVGLDKPRQVTKIDEIPGPDIIEAA